VRRTALDVSSGMLSVQGSSSEDGLAITPHTTLLEVRESFPVPNEFAFAVPAVSEANLFLSDFMPLLLLKLEEKSGPTLLQRPLPNRSRAELDEEIMALKTELARERSLRQNAVAECTAAKEAHQQVSEQLAASTRSGKQDYRRKHTNMLSSLASEPEILRAQLLALKEAVAGLRNEVGGMLGKSLQQCLAKATRGKDDELRALRASLDRARSLANARDSYSSTLEMKSTNQQQLIERLRMQLDQAKEPPKAIAAPSGAFASYMRVSQLKRECDALQKAGKDLIECPHEAARRETFSTSLSRVAVTSSGLLRANGVLGSIHAAMTPSDDLLTMSVAGGSTKAKLLDQAGASGQVPWNAVSASSSESKLFNSSSPCKQPLSRGHARGSYSGSPSRSTAGLPTLGVGRGGRGSQTLRKSL
jgi:hypothetical protein